jgi:hypothetical protein
MVVVTSKTNRRMRSSLFKVHLTVPAVQMGPLLPFVLFDQLPNLRFDRVEIERGRALHRRIVDGCLCQIGDCLLYEHEIRGYRSRSCSRRPNHSGFRHGSRGVRSKGSWRRLTIVGMAVVTFSPGQPYGC